MLGNPDCESGQAALPTQRAKTDVQTSFVEKQAPQKLVASLNVQRFHASSESVAPELRGSTCTGMVFATCWQIWTVITDSSIQHTL